MPSILHGCSRAQKGSSGFEPIARRLTDTFKMAFENTMGERPTASRFRFAVVWPRGLLIIRYQREARANDDAFPSTVKLMYNELQQEPIVEPDTENKTTFYGNDTEANYPDKYRLDGSRQSKNHYDRLTRHNRGLLGKYYDRAIVRRNDNLAILDAVANSVELPEYHHRIARNEIERAPLSKWSSPNGIYTILSAIMICAVVCLKDPRYNRTYNPDRNDETNDDLFDQLLDRFSYSDSQIRSCYQKVLRHVGWEPVDWTDHRND